MDKGYDNNRVFDETRERGAVPIICVRKGRAIPLTPIPYGTPEWKGLYRGRAAVEREFDRLKHEYALAPLRVRCLFSFTLTSASSPGSACADAGTSGFASRVSGQAVTIEIGTRKERAMLMILHSVCAEALEAFYAADNAVDTELVADLERMVERTRREIEALARQIANPS